jgi:regulator of protease activity HflC (stomatin/prohibitin superfamily)
MDPRGRLADPVGIAIHRVLEAERQAQADIARARADADALVAAARGEALAVSARADRRLAAARAAVDSRLARREAEVNEALRALRARDPREPGDDERIRRAAERLAADLTGGQAP